MQCTTCRTHSHRHTHSAVHDVQCAHFAAPCRAPQVPLGALDCAVLSKNIEPRSASGVWQLEAAPRKA